MARSFVEELQRRVHERTGMFATWLPTDGIHVGEYGTIKKGRFQFEGQVKHFGIELSEGSYTTENSKLGFSDRATYSLRNDLKGKSVGNAVCEIELQAKGAFIFQLQNIEARFITYKPDFYKQLVGLIVSRPSVWAENFVIIDSVRIAGAATIIVSESESARVVLSGEISTDPEGEVPLARMKGRFSVQVSRGSAFQTVCTKTITPLYSHRKLIFDPDENKSGTITMLYTWIREKFGREVIKPEEIAVSSFSSYTGEDIIRFRDLNSKCEFVVSARKITFDETLDSDGGPGGGGPKLKTLEYEKVQARSTNQYRKSEQIKQRGNMKL